MKRSSALSPISNRNALNAIAALEQRKEQAKYELAQTIKDMIAEQGYALNDIVPLLGIRKRRGPARLVAAPRRSGRIIASVPSMLIPIIPIMSILAALLLAG